MGGGGNLIHSRFKGDGGMGKRGHEVDKIRSQKIMTILATKNLLFHFKDKSKKFGDILEI